MTLDPTLRVFFEEATDLLHDFEDGLLRLEQTPGDREVLNRVFRSAHTLKGNSAMLGFEAIAQFTHVLEDLLMRLRDGELVVARPMMDTLLVSADVLRALLQRERDHDGAEVAHLEETLRALQVHARGEVAAPLPTRPAPSPEPSAVPILYEIHFVPPRDLLRRGLDPVRILDSLEELGKVVRVEPDLSLLPPLREMDPESAYLGFTCWLRSHEPRERIADCFEFVGEAAVVEDPGCPREGE